MRPCCPAVAGTGERLELRFQHLRHDVAAGAGAAGAFASYLAWMWMLAHYPATKISVFVFLTRCLH